MNESQLETCEHTALAENGNSPHQPMEFTHQECSSPEVVQTPPDEKWVAIKHGIYVAGATAIVAIFVFGTTGRTFKVSGDYKGFSFAMSLSRAVTPAA